MDTTTGKCIFIDPSRQDLLFCMDKKVPAKKFRKFRREHKPQNIQECETRLSMHTTSTVDVEKFIEYFQVRAKVNPKLSEYDVNENVEKAEREPNPITFRK